MPRLILVLIVALVDLGWAQIKPQTCQDLPKLPMPDIWALIANSPYITDYSMLAVPECASQVFAIRALGRRDYVGSLIGVQRTAVTIYDYRLSSDKKTISMTICMYGVVQVWYMAAYKFNGYGSYYCIYICDGISVVEFQCNSNNKTEFYNDEQAAMALITDVPNSDKIHPIKSDCFTKGCAAFY